MKKIAICGFNLESNRFAAPCDRQDFEEEMYLHGDEISQQARHKNPSIDLGVCGFYKVMDEASGGPDNWIARPSVLISSQPAGAVKEDFFNEFLEELKSDLQRIGEIDGVYICEHGGAIATHTHGCVLRLLPRAHICTRHRFPQSAANHFLILLEIH